MFKLRPYQKDVIQTFSEKNSGLAILPTGSGKSLIIADLIRNNLVSSSHVGHIQGFVITPTLELVDQLTNTISNYLSSFEGYKIAIQHSYSNRSISKISIDIPNCALLNMFVGTHLSINKLLFDPSNIHLKDDILNIIIDECHMIPCNTINEIMEILGVNHNISHNMTFGLSACIDRLDKKTINMEIVHKTNFYDLVPEYLCEPIFHVIDNSTSISTKSLIECGLKHVLPDKNTIVFGSNKKEAMEAFLSYIKKHPEASCAFVSSTDSFENDNGNPVYYPRKEVVQNIVKNKYKTIFNIQIFIHGFDWPSCNRIVILRNTESKSMFLQMVGRGSRLDPANNKKTFDVYCILDRDFISSAYMIEWVKEEYKFDIKTGDIHKDAYISSLITNKIPKLDKDKLDFITMESYTHLVSNDEKTFPITFEEYNVINEFCKLNYKDHAFYIDSVLIGLNEHIRSVLFYNSKYKITQIKDISKFKYKNLFEYVERIRNSLSKLIYDKDKILNKIEHIYKIRPNIRFIDYILMTDVRDYKVKNFLKTYIKNNYRISCQVKYMHDSISFDKGQDLIL